MAGFIAVEMRSTARSAGEFTRARPTTSRRPPAVIHHANCGSGFLADGKLRHGFARRTGYDEEALAALPVLDPARTVQADAERLLAAPQVSPRITVSGHVYDVDTGLVTTIIDPTSPQRR